MNQKYDKCMNQWNEIFENEQLNIPEKKYIDISTFDEGLEWLTTDSEYVLDFGCGNGTMLFLCGLYGTKEHIGIDLSDKAIEKAVLRSEEMKTGTYTFYKGGVEKIKDVEDDSVDAVILSNIIDNLYPEDAKTVLKEVHRVLVKQGKVFVQLNPYMSSEKMKEVNVEVVEGNLLDDGLLLWNNTNEEWSNLFEQYFEIEQYKAIYYANYEQTNRLFLLIRK